MLADVGLAAGDTGGTEYVKNIGSLDSHGFEVSLNVVAIKTDDLSLIFGGNIAYNYGIIPS